VVRFVPAPTARIEEVPIVVFDFETTGLDINQDRIIEIGAEKLVGFEVVDTFSTFISTDVELSAQIQQLTGITPDMLTGQPRVEDVLPEFLQFVDGSLMVAHNAEFDFTMLRAAALRLGYEVDLPCFCTLKMARTILPKLENRKLDTLAAHYNLTFSSRHRSMGDVRVTAEVLKNLLTVDGDGLDCWKDLEPFNVT
jgi:DNA polymerase III epsilon subunit family exonuclease